ncbi:hypothetical protein [Myxococcus virescens]|uniref:Uncharacterized protein n=1 Tax=Myxococcus virescens TaxID=83456 RepID=A0A511HFR3_9BACT|nr:hypothetical protein [Myxococcus virescens]GEL72315.1 hypothetical protein MVI01_40990 [Myxococcus virescens]SDD70655.1 hypothetical protein SAMN04488504_102353 [Myxococcus virescens]
MTGAPLFALLALVSTQYDGSSTVEEVSSEEEVSSTSRREGAPVSAARLDEPAPPGSTHTGGVGFGFSGQLEVGGLSLPSGPRGGGQDFFARIYPSLGLTHGETFVLRLGANLRLRVVDEAPTTTEDYSGGLRREDWDELSDFGQVVRMLRIGQEGRPFFLRVEPFSEETLGRGYLVGRYSNALAPDYHPAGGSLTFVKGAVRAEILASDVLAARIFAGEALLDIGRMASDDANRFDRYLIRLSAAHDAGRAGGTSPDLTLASVGGDVALYKGERLRAWALLGGGARFTRAYTPAFGGLLGVALAGQMASGTQVSVTVQGRKQGGRFRFGMFGPDYELGRFSGVGLSETPIADEVLPSGFAGYVELSVAKGNPNELLLLGSVAAQYFGFGRTDTDVSAGFELPGGRTRALARVVLTGLGDRPRYSAGVELRQRIVNHVYAWGSGGTVHFPQPDGTLVRGVTAGAGVGVDFQR